MMILNAYGFWAHWQ